MKVAVRVAGDARVNVSHSLAQRGDIEVDGTSGSHGFLGVRAANQVRCGRWCDPNLVRYACCERHSAGAMPARKEEPMSVNSDSCAPGSVREISQFVIFHEPHLRDLASPNPMTSASSPVDELEALRSI